MEHLFDIAPELPAGCWLLRQFLTDHDQTACVRFSRDLLTSHPLMQPKTLKGFDLALKVTSWGKVGWFGDNGRYRYLDRHENGKPWPEIPLLFKSIIARALLTSLAPDIPIKNELNPLALLQMNPLPEFRLDTVLLNYYPAKTGKLGRHQDVTEEDKESPIVTISIGDSCIFNIGNTNYDDKGIDVQIDSGDVFVMACESRLAYHGVKKILPGTSDLLKNGGRISLTGRKVFIP